MRMSAPLWGLRPATHREHGNQRYGTAEPRLYCYSLSQPRASSLPLPLPPHASRSPSPVSMTNSTTPSE